MIIEKSKDVKSFRDYGCQQLINLNKVYAFELYERKILFFYITNSKPIAWKYKSEQKALETLEEIKRLISQGVYINEEEN